MRDDPCFRCTLPECDAASAQCQLRKLSNHYSRKLHRGEHALITDQEREAANEIFHIWHLDRSAEAAEGGRPYKRWERESRIRRGREDASA
ncbi:hypothetical protein [Mesorhizobium sp. 1M-11]|uniref:hypothetical protein n=1 Tax=Mesorhizobium sp. 1M-11 TaxID=1529006 RepID=UPI000A9F3E9D|nr:hypothetical protein [Mesorhizobium sp. 1M-11]